MKSCKNISSGCDPHNFLHCENGTRCLTTSLFYHLSHKKPKVCHLESSKCLLPIRYVHVHLTALFYFLDTEQKCFPKLMKQLPGDRREIKLFQAGSFSPVPLVCCKGGCCYWHPRYIYTHQHMMKIKLNRLVQRHFSTLYRDASLLTHIRLLVPESHF